MLGYGEHEAPRYPRVGLPLVATFHGLGRELLERYGRVIGIPRHFGIFDRDDSERAVKEALKALDVDPKEVSPRLIMAIISKAKGRGETADTFGKEGQGSWKTRIAGQAWALYEDILVREKALDFDDLISRPVRLLEEHADVRAAVQNSFPYVHVDEYQDTSALQGRLIELVSGGTRNVFVVGDIDQTIYTWRDATIENLLQFERTFPGAKTIVLEHNYRSSKTIVDAANAIIEKNKNRKEKYSTTDNPKGEPILLKAVTTGDEEALWIADAISRTIAEGVLPEHIAVLFRTNFQSRALEEAMLRAQIPYRLLGTRFYDRKEVKDTLAWIRLSLEPTREADRMRAVQAPPRGIGKVTLGKLAAGKREELRAGEKTKVEAFERVVSELHEASKTVAPSAFVRFVLEKSGMEESLLKGGEDDQERLENARELGTLAARYDGILGQEGIAQFLSDAALAGDQDELDRKEAKGVVLMTVHAAKGLEFDTVYIAGMEEGLFPHEGFEEDDERDEEEERRLFYVAITRAKRRLILSFARVRKIYGTDYLSEPSSFLSELDPSLTTYVEDTEPIIEA
jgi:DNA helicase-2/ATP-dependent DNA helicase PcrA